MISEVGGAFLTGITGRWWRSRSAALRLAHPQSFVFQPASSFLPPSPDRVLVCRGLFSVGSRRTREPGVFWRGRLLFLLIVAEQIKDACVDERRLLSQL